PTEFFAQPIAQRPRCHTELLENRNRDSVRLIEKRDQKMFVINFLMMKRRCDIVRRLQRLLHLLSKFIRSHYCNLQVASEAPINRGKSLAWRLRSATDRANTLRF